MRASSITLLALFGLVAVSGTALAAETPEFYLCNDAHSALPGMSVMHLDEVSPCSDGGMATIPAGACRTWAAEFPAGQDVQFEKANWVASILTMQGSTNVRPYQYPMTLGSTAVPNAVSGVVTFAHPRFLNAETGTGQTSQSGTFTVASGEYLTFQLCNPAGSGKTMELFTDGPSYVLAPANSPPYPTPELGTLALMGAGIVGLAAVGRRFA